MTQSVIAHTLLTGSSEAGCDLGSQILEAFGGKAPQVLILFASPQHDHERLLRAVEASCHPEILVGCSTAGEFTTQAQTAGSACAVALRSEDMAFASGLGRGMRENCPAVARDLVSSFRGMTCHTYPYRTALILTDALSGHAEELVEHVNLLTAGQYQLFGGGAGDDARFQSTQVFHGTEVASNAVVALEILSHKPLGLGMGHGWQPGSAAMRVTSADGLRLSSLNAVPVLEVFEDYAAATGQVFDQTDPTPFFLHNVIGIHTEEGPKLRAPLRINPDGSITCAAEVPSGAMVHIMSVKADPCEAAARATQAAMQQLNGQEPQVALFFECVATHVRLGAESNRVLQAVETGIAPAGYAGFNTIGQIIRSDGQFSGFHNCSAVVCVIPA
ncbi:MAG: FIST C-terminal domain-containing protein [Chloroflexi bacterium]|nr:FIST C-terminal domain-containing protein [Chloroflexota bacterium]